MILNKTYNRETFLDFIARFLPDFNRDIRPVRTSEKSILQNVSQLGEALEDNELTVFEVDSDESDANKRVAITQAAFKMLKEHGVSHALIAFHHGKTWRLSFLTTSYSIKDGAIVQNFSNPRRYSYLLGPEAKTNTPYQYLYEKGEVKSREELQDRFSVEVVNKEFYANIAEQFTKLVGGERGGRTYAGLLVLNGKSETDDHKEFAVRLIGRLIFTWFLKEKKSKAGEPLIPTEMLSSEAITKHEEYYHSVLEPLFFETLNKREERRFDQYREAPFNKVPYLNGGLFAPQPEDFYKSNRQQEITSQVDIPDSWFKELFEILELYNFTVDENTSYNTELSIDPEMLGRIFENLLAEINPETNESARKNTGSYYTPREIVDYMVDNSILEYLKNKTDIPETKLKTLISWNPDDDTEHPLTQEEKRVITNWLNELKILDLACGSGAFPIGILQKVVYILQQIDPDGEIWLKQQLATIQSPELKRDIAKKYELENYDWLRKYGVIRTTIFGVDIQPIATEISRLRCFLTLIIDEEVNDGDDNRGIHPLPNLDFKFITANSLVGLPETKTVKGDAVLGMYLDMFEDISHIDELKDIRGAYFNAGNNERQELQIEFQALQKQMLQDTIEAEGISTDLYKILSKWNPFSHESSPWFDADWVFGIDKFDIVIGNPPYIGEKGNKTIFEPLKTTKLGKRFYMGKMDLFYYFFHQGIDHLAEGGILTFITTNYYPTADGAAKLRKDFYERTNVKTLVNFGEITVFDSAKGQHNLITILEKADSPDENNLTNEIIAQGKGSISSGAITNLLNGESELAVLVQATRDRVFDTSTGKFYIRFSGEDEKIETELDRLSSTFKRLGDTTNINQGIVSGADKFSNAHTRKFPTIDARKGEGIFVFDESETAKIIDSSDVAQPWFKNSDIKQYVTAKETDETLIYLDGVSTPTPKLLSYLKRFRPILSARREFLNGKRPWYELHWPREKQIFEGAKIVAPQRSKRNTFAYNDIPWFASADVYFITEKTGTPFRPFYLLGILNSNLIYEWLYRRGKRKGEMLELYRTPLTEIPIPETNKDIQEAIENLVQQVIKIKERDSEADIKDLQAKIDKLVFEAYGVDSKMFVK